jgi:predicted GNAT family N-acyltransferase
VLAAALAHARAHGAELVWCNARVPARAFYERAGFAVHGDEWEDPDIGPHVAMAVDLATAGPAGAEPATGAGPAAAEPAGPVG